MLSLTRANAPTTDPAATSCPACGAAVAPTWAFCGHCSVRIAGSTQAHLPAVSPPAIPSPRRADDADGRRGRRQPPASRQRRVRPVTVLASAVVLVFLASLVLLIVDDATTHGRYTSTHHKLVSARQSLATTQTAVATTRSQLASTTSQRDQLQSQLADARTRLDGVRGSLATAQNRVNLQASEMSQLKTCLDGFSNALQADLYGDYSAGLSALQSVETACRAAQNAVG